MNNSMVGYVALAVQSFVIFMALSENGGCKRRSDNELVSEVSAPLSAAKWCDDRRNNT